MFLLGWLQLIFHNFKAEKEREILQLFLNYRFIRLYRDVVDIFESLGNVILATDEEQVTTTTTAVNTNTTTTTASPVKTNQATQQEIEGKKKQVSYF